MKGAEFTIMIKNDVSDVKQEEKTNLNNENKKVSYNTFEERRKMNIAAFIITIIALITLCCMPFDLYYGKPACYIEYEDGKLMLAILLSMAFFYFLSFDMVAFCVASVNVAFLAINTYQRILYETSELLPGFYVLWSCSILVMIVHFLYPYIVKKIRNKK